MEEPIGVFDSGVGGLTVLKEIIALLPGENTIYLGDTARVPYGSKSAHTVTRFALQIADFLLERGIKMLVVACNTASAFSLPSLQQKLSLPVVGVITPGAVRALAVSRNRKIGVIGTEGTVQSGAYLEALRARDHRAEVYMQACPLFVPLVEEGWLNGEIARLTAAHYLDSLRREHVDTLILGCTHYPLLKDIIAQEMGPQVTLVDSAAETAREVARILDEKGLRNSSSGPAGHKFYVTDAAPRFIRLGRDFLQGNLPDPAEVTLVSLP